jgi:hypothetical protein
MKRKVPKLRSDTAAETFLDQDLSDLDFSQFRPAWFELQRIRRSPNFGSCTAEDALKPRMNTDRPNIRVNPCPSVVPYNLPKHRHIIRPNQVRRPPSVQVVFRQACIGEALPPFVLP